MRQSKVDNAHIRPGAQHGRICDSRATDTIVDEYEPGAAAPHVDSVAEEASAAKRQSHATDILQRAAESCPRCRIRVAELAVYARPLCGGQPYGKRSRARPERIRSGIRPPAIKLRTRIAIRPDKRTNRRRSLTRVERLRHVVEDHGSGCHDLHRHGNGPGDDLWRAHVVQVIHRAVDRKIKHKVAIFVVFKAKCGGFADRFPSTPLKRKAIRGLCRSAGRTRWGLGACGQYAQSNTEQAGAQQRLFHP